MSTVSATRLARVLLFMRLTVFVVMFVWTLDKFVNPAHASGIFAYFYGIGGVSEMVVKSEGMTLLIRMLTDEYFLAVILPAEANFGKARFLMRMAEDGLRAQL